MPLTVAAQRVQRSAYPSAYADDEPLARQLLAGRTGAAVRRSAAAEVASAPMRDRPIPGR